jgi:hypothetical protein
LVPRAPVNVRVGERLTHIRWNYTIRGMAEKKRLWSALALVLTISVPIATARAETAAEVFIPNHPALTDRFSVTAGLLYLDSSTNAVLTTASGGTGVIVNFEDTLGMEDRSYTGLFGFTWRFAERWRLETEYFRLNRDAIKTLATEIKWNDVSYPIGTTVESTFNFYDVRVGASYSFYKTRDKELGVGLGMHVAGITARIAEPNLGDEQGKVLAPLPTLNLYGNFALTDEWALRFRVDYFSLTYDEFGGSLTSTGLDLLYQPFRHVGFGLGLRNYSLEVDLSDPDWHGRVNMQFTGPTLFVTGSF